MSSPSLVSAAEAAPRRRSARRRWRWVVLLALAGGVLVWTRNGWWPPVFQSLARSALARRDPDAALKWLNVATSFAKEDATTALLSARAYRKQGQMEQAGQALERARALQAPSAELELETWLALAQSGQMREAEQQLPRLLTARSADDPEICEAFVLGYLRVQRPAAALPLLEAWMKDWPTQARPYVLRGRIRVLRSEFRKAEADFRRACDLEPNDLEAVLDLAEAVHVDNRPAEAIPLFERCVDDRHLGTRAKVGLAKCLKATGRPERVKLLLQQAVASSPRDVEALRELGRAELETGDYAAAVRACEAALRILPQEDEVHYLLAQALQAQGMAVEAKPHFEFVQRAREGFRELSRLEDELQSSPGDPEVLSQMGAILLEFGDPEEGVIRLLAALDRHPNHQQARRLLVAHYERRATERPEFRRLAETHRAWLKDGSQLEP